MNIKLPLPKDFLKEEIRANYLISSKIKKTWAVQLDLLQELKRVCEKYDLQYYADSGTLIGAVRHKGYIPWDDDIDLVMKRKDYNRLIEVGKVEFTHPYFLHSAHSERFPRGFARLRNSDSTALTKYDFAQNIDHGIFIDIFPLDNVPDNETIRKIWLKEIDIIFKVLFVGTIITSKKYNDILHKARYYTVKCLYSAIGYDNLLALYERKCGKYNSIQTKKVSYVAYSRGKEKHIWDSECFASSHSVPFEFTEIMIPDGYDSRLKTEYGDYMKPAIAPTVHGKMILEPDIPYREYMKTHSIDDLSAQLDL